MNRATQHGNRGSRTRGFTLVELLIVITIIAVLIATMLPSLSQATSNARLVRCTANLQQYGVAFHTYGYDFQNYVVPQMHLTPGGQQHNWALLLSIYMGENYGSLSKWSSVNISNGATARRGTAHACPAEDALNGVPVDMPSTVPQAAGQIGYGYFGTVIPGKFYFTTYGMNLYGTRRRTPDIYDTTAANYQTFSSGPSCDMRKIDRKIYPSEVWLFSENYPMSPYSLVTAAALTRSKSYAKMNFDRHNSKINISYFDGHAGVFVLDSMPLEIADPNDSPFGESVSRGYKHWGISDNQSTGW